MPGRSLSVYLNRVDNDIRFNQYTFMPDSGDLIHLDPEGNKTIDRLAPQPSRLLALLIQRYPEMVSHDEIKQEVWPEVEVDFERSLHFCIRQIRAALQDNANDPVYIQTIPRRGYRWLVQPDLQSERLKSSGKRRTRLTMYLILLVVACMTFFWFRYHQETKPAPTTLPVLRIAVLPFQTPDSSLTVWSSSIALGLVEILTNQVGTNHQVIGPTTTISYLPDHLPELIKDYDIDFVINGRFITRDETSGVLAEVIRATDGAHVWVRFYTPETTVDTAVAQIRSGLLKQ